MRTIKLIASIDSSHRLHAVVPPTMGPGNVEVLVLVPEEDHDQPTPLADLIDSEWQEFVAHGLRVELADVREDIYSPEDGEPVDAKW